VRRQSSLAAAFLILGSLALPASATAEPIRISVAFTVTGSPADPDFGTVTSTGLFSFITAQPPGTDVLYPDGLGLETMSFNWAGVDWSTTNADVYRIGREPDGRVFAFSVGGTPSALDLSASVPDFRLLFCVADVQTPEGGCSYIRFDYSTSASSTLGTFTGFVSQLSVSREPVDAPVPEPMTILLVAGGLGAIAARTRSRGRRNPGTPHNLSDSFRG
jgi:hypothetical protein